MRGAAPVVVLGLAACVIPGLEVDDGAGTGTSASTGVLACESTPFPEPAGKGSGAALDLRFALATLDFGERTIDVDQSATDCSAPRDRVGFDLDGRCSGCACTTAEPSCNPVAGEQCDGVRGIDNGIAQVIGPYAQTLGNGVGSSQLTEDAANGRYVVLLRVWSYDGSSDDDAVSFAIYGGRAPTPAPPAWDGADVYPVAGESVDRWNVVGAVDRPLVRTDQAYVVGDRLVAVLEGAIPFGPPGFALPFTSGRVEATLQHTGDRWSLVDATVGGRTEVRPFLSAAGELASLGTQLCNVTGIWGRFKELSCENRDLPPGAPGPVPCSAISFGFRFDARDVRFGEVVAPVTAQTVCPTLAPDPCAF